MRQGLLSLLGVIAILQVSVPARAQERPNGFFLTSPLSLSSGYDQGFLSGSRALDGNVSILTSPTVSWIANTHRTTFSVDYKAEFDMFARDQSLDAWDHTANLRFRRQITSRLSVDAADSFVSTMDATQSLTNSLLLLPRGRYQENAFFARLAYRLDHRTVVSFRVDNDVTTMALPPALAGRLDNVGVAGTLTVDHTLTRHHALSASYSYLYLHPLAGGPQAVGTGVNNLTLGYVYSVNPSLTVRLSGGVTRAAQSSFTGAAAVDKKVGGVWLSAGYQRYLAFFGGLAPMGAPAGPLPFAPGVTPNSVYQVAAFRAWGKLTNRLGLTGGLQRALNGVTPDNRGIKSVIAQVRVDYKINERVTAFVLSEFYGQNVSEFSTFPMSRRRYFGGLEFALSRPPIAPEDSHRRNPLPAGSAQSQQGDGNPPD